MKMMLKSYIRYYAFIFMAVLGMNSLTCAIPYDPEDPRHKLVGSILENFTNQINARQSLLGTRWKSVALADIMRERLDKGVFKPSDPDWALAVKYLLLGYGFEAGIVDTSSLEKLEQPTQADLVILNTAYALSSAYLAARDDRSRALLDQVYTKEALQEVLKKHLDALNKTAGNVPARTVQRVKDSSQKLFVVAALTADMDSDQCSLVVEAINKVPKAKYTQAFVKACDDLSDGVNASQKVEIIRYVAAKHEHYQAFTDTCLGLTVGTSAGDKMEVILSITALPPAKYTPEFVTTCKGVFTMDDKAKRPEIISAIGSASSDKYVPKFFETCKRMSAGPEGLKLLSVAEALFIVPFDKYELLEEAYNLIGSGINQKNKEQLLGLLANILATQGARNFIADCKTAIAGKNENQKLKAIRQYMMTSKVKV